MTSIDRCQNHVLEGSQGAPTLPSPRLCEREARRLAAAGRVAFTGLNRVKGRCCAVRQQFQENRLWLLQGIR
jgi:hypothetical protein